MSSAEKPADGGKAQAKDPLKLEVEAGEADDKNWTLVSRNKKVKEQELVKNPEMEVGGASLVDLKKPEYPPAHCQTDCTWLPQFHLKGGAPRESQRVLAKEDVTLGGVEQYVCDYCEKRYQQKKNLNKHKKQSHSTDPEANQCDVCGQIFESKDLLKYHKQRKKNGRITGCFVRKSNSERRSETSSQVHWPGQSTGSVVPSPSPSPDRSSVTLFDTDNEEQDGFDDTIIKETSDDFKRFALRMKQKNNNNVVFEVRDTASRVIIKTRSLSYLLGSAQACVESVLSHSEFDSVCDPEENPKNKDSRDDMFELVFVDNHQKTAYQKHLDSADKCENQCNLLKRRIRFHQQQVMLGLEAINLPALTKDKWMDFVEGHMRMLKINDGHYKEFQNFLISSYPGDMFEAINILIENIKDRNSVAFSPNTHAAPQSRRKDPHSGLLQLSQAALDRAEQRQKRREKRRKQIAEEKIIEAEKKKNGKEVNMHTW